MLRLISSFCLALAVLFVLGGCGSEGTCSGDDCQCTAGNSCAFDCTGTPGCNQQCDGDCDLTCAAGNCDQACTPGSDCTVDCEGGGCNQQCAPGATCTFGCSGGGCDQSCLGSATCSTTCGDSSCRTDDI